MTFRICYTKTDVLTWEINPVYAAGGTFRGDMGGRVNSYVRIFLRVVSNVTVYSDEFAFDEPQHGERYAGCRGRLQLNQSDVIANELLYPTVGQNLTNGPIILADKTAFISTYPNYFPMRYADIMQSFHAFSVKVWIMIILSALFMMLMISTSKSFTKSQRTITTRENFKRLLEQRDREKLLREAGFLRNEKRVGKHVVEWLVVLYNSLIKRSTNGASRSSLSVATLTLMLLVLSFYVTFFFMAIVKTNKVTMTKPSTIQSYDDIINSYPTMKTIFFMNIRSHVPFMKAKAGSKEGRIWQNAVHTGLNDSLSKSVVEGMQRFARSEVICIAPGVYIESLACGYCRLKKQLDLTTIPMAKSDESAKEEHFVFLLSGHLPSAIAARLTQVFGRLLPSGFGQGSLAHTYRHNGITYEDSDVCLSNVVRFPDQHFSGISLNQCEKLIMAVIILSVTSFIMLLMEILFCRTQTNRKE